jgi:serine-type D-Ala-D-Ala carboxypeptidase
MGRRMRSLIQEGVTQNVFPGAAALIAQNGRIVSLEHIGYRSLIPEPAPMAFDTIFDLASLTKPLATTLSIMKLVDKGKIVPDQPLEEALLKTDLRDKRNLTLRLLLSHSAGLVEWKAFHEPLMEYPLQDRIKLLREWIIKEPFAYKPGKGNVYSDLGFMLLEWVIEEKTGQPLPQYVHEQFYRPLGLKRTIFRGTSEERTPRPPPFAKRGRVNDGRGEGRWPDSRLRRNDVPGIDYPSEEFAPTEDCPWRKRVLQGEVHDDNAWALGGYSGHAGLFSTVKEVHVIANMVREHFLGMRRDYFKPETVREFFRRQGVVKGSDWALGWDTRAPAGSSAGRFFSRDSVGHTGFTGTSIWMDLEKDVIAILLTNRVHPKRENEKMKQFRPMFHDAIMEDLGLASA